MKKQELFPGFQVETLLNETRMQSSYVIKDIATHSRYHARVIKKPETIQEQKYLDRALSKARITQRVQSPNTPAVANIFETEDEYTVIIRELRDGRTLKEERESRRLPLSEIITLLTSTAKAVGAYHANGYVFLNIHPNHIAISEDGKVILQDTGMCAAIGDAVLLTTPYTRRQEKDADIQDDLYSLGCLMFYLITGLNPMQEHILYNTQFPLQASAIIKDIPAEADTIICKATERGYENTDAFIADLEKLNSSRQTDLPQGMLVLNRYRIIKRADAGISDVYCVLDTEDSKLKCLKMTREIEQTGMKHEISIMNRLDHPAIPRITETGDNFIVMDWVEGHDLKCLTRSGMRLEPCGAVNLTREVCSILSHMHSKGILYRDIKPASILLDNSNHASIVDFGTALNMQEQAVLPDALGTKGYAAPELYIPGSPCDPRSDIYSLGAVLYELVTGTRLEERTSQTDETIPADLLAIVKKATAPAPEDRYQTAEEMEKALYCIRYRNPKKGMDLPKINFRLKRNGK